MIDSKGEKPHIRKLGTLECGLVETTPVVFGERLMLFEYMRDRSLYPRGGEVSCFRFLDVETGRSSPDFAHGYHLGSAFVHEGTAYAFGVEKWGGPAVDTFWSRDLSRWSSKEGLSLPGWRIFNTSVCRDAESFVMAFEIDAPPEEAGEPFTIRFARSQDLLSWSLTPSPCVFSKDRYTACPAIRFFDDWYYMVYLEALPGPNYESHIVRSHDLESWEQSPLNPFLAASEDDRLIANPALSPEERNQVWSAVNLNNSDVDLCEFQGKTVIYYSWGNQLGIEHLAVAEYHGGLRDLLKGFFPEP